MISSSCKPLVVISLVFAVSSAVNAEEPMVVTISAKLRGPTTFVITRKDAPGRDVVKSSSLLIQNTLLPALLTGAKVEVDLASNKKEIYRVTPFAPGNAPKVKFGGDYQVSRIATQRREDGTGEHLEVFLKKSGSEEEKAYNVYDSFLQQMLIAAFRKGERVDVQLDAGEIATVTLGEKLGK
jgi:hypothetical protein